MAMEIISIGIVILSCVMIGVEKEMVYGALWLIHVFMCMSVEVGLLHGYYWLGFQLVLVYIGAVAVLVVFVVLIVSFRESNTVVIGWVIGYIVWWLLLPCVRVLSNIEKEVEIGSLGEILYVKWRGELLILGGILLLALIVASEMVGKAE